jgi:hypothetical protein
VRAFECRRFGLGIETPLLVQWQDFNRLPKILVVIIEIKPKSNPQQATCKANQADSRFSREAAAECSPRRKPWVNGGKRSSSGGAKEQL